mgnify:CR=1 FL=1
MLKKKGEDWVQETGLALAAARDARAPPLAQLFQHGLLLALALALCALLSGYQGLKGRREALVHASGYSLAALIAITTQSAFIDLHLFWLASVFLIALFVQQALTLLREQRIRALSQAFSRLDTSQIYLKPAIREMIETEFNSPQLTTVK